MTAPSEAEPRSERRLDRAALLQAAAWLVGGAAGVRLLEGFFADNPAAAAVLGAFLVDLMAGRAGVRWSEHAEVPWWRDARRGLAVGATIGMLVLVVGHAVGWATIVLGVPSLSLAFAALRVVALAARDELLLRVLPMVLGGRAGVPAPWLIGFCGLAAMAPHAASGAAPASIVLAGAMGILGARLVQATRGAVASVAAHAGFVMAIGPLSRGGFLDVRWCQGDPGPAPLAQGLIGWAAAAALLLAAWQVPRFVRSAAPPTAPPPTAPPPSQHSPETSSSLGSAG